MAESLPVRPVQVAIAVLIDMEVLTGTVMYSQEDVSAGLQVQRDTAFSLCFHCLRG